MDLKENESKYFVQDIGIQLLKIRNEPTKLLHILIQNCLTILDKLVPKTKILCRTHYCLLFPSQNDHKLMGVQASGLIFTTILCYRVLNQNYVRRAVFGTCTAHSSNIWL